MGEADDGLTKPGATSGNDAVRSRLDRLVAQASVASVWEQAWPLLWRGLAIILIFLAVSWLGLWLDLGPAGRMAGLALFAIAVIAALAPLARIGRPSRRAALARIDRDAAAGGGKLAHAPASAIETRSPSARAIPRPRPSGLFIAGGRPKP